MLRRPKRKSQLKGISLTTGVERSAEDEAERIAQIMRVVRQFNVPIGDAVCLIVNSHRILRDAGAPEIKCNVETVDKEISQEGCRGPSLREVRTALADAPQLLGKNHAFTSILIGLGESDQRVIEGMDKLALLGDISMLRAIVEHPLRAEEMQMRRPSTERLLYLAKMERRTPDKYGLRADGAETMCALRTG